MKTYVSNPCGYCQGVARAIALALSFKKNHPDKTCYVLGALVHNDTVSKELANYGIISLEENISNEEKIKKLPDGSAVIFSAHGHDQKLENLLKKRKLTFLDATCPTVEVSANNIEKAIEDNHQVIFIGKPNHPETNAMLAIDKNVFLYENIKDNLKKIILDQSPFVSTQTTLSVYEVEDIFKEIKVAFPNAIFQDEICHETKLRQDAIKSLPSDVDAVFVIGGEHSSNTRRLFELAKKHFSTLKIFQILNEYDVDPLKDKLKGCLSCAIISGASTPLKETMKVKVKLEEIW